MTAGGSGGDAAAASIGGLHHRGGGGGAAAAAADAPPPSLANAAAAADVDVEAAIGGGGSGGSGPAGGKDAAVAAGAANGKREGAGGAGDDEQQQQQQDQEEEEEYAAVSYADIAKQFSLLGWTAFGGPAAHIGLFQRRLVERLRWMSEEVYGELFALGQCMPGPTSTQVSFAIGVVKKGVKGGLLSGALFQYPGALIMTAVGVFAAKLLENPSGALNGVAAGVSAVGVALVASAAKGMASKLCATPVLAVICTVATVVAFYWPKPYTFPVLIALGGLATLLLSYYRREQLPAGRGKGSDTSVRSHGLNMWWGAAVLAAWLVTLVVTVVLGQLPGAPPPLKWWEVFYRTGSIIYGGGQVVLPMLYSDVVQRVCDPVTGACSDAPNTWVTSKQFYAGLGVVQALPGPLFNFAAYLGAIIATSSGYTFIWGTLLAWFGLFSPGILIIFGIMPYWGKFRTWGPYRRALPGLNAAGVGLIVASVFSLALGALGVSDFRQMSLCIGVAAFTAVDQLKWFEPGVVVAGGVAGIIAWAAKAM